MLRKLIRHEFRATARLMPLLCLIVIALGVLAHFVLKLLDLSSLPFVVRLFLGSVIPLFIAALVAVYVVAVVVMVARFKRNVLGDEGYLTMTLPVSVHSIIWSKIIVSAAWFIAAALADAIAVWLAFFMNESVFEIIRDIWNGLMFFTGNNAWLIIEALLWLFATCFAGIVTSCLNFYAALSIGHGFSRGKMGFSVLFYFLLNSAASVLMTVVILVLSQSVLKVGVPSFGTSFAVSAMAEWRLLMGTVLGVYLVNSGIFYLLTCINLKKRLNLE